MGREDKEQLNSAKQAYKHAKAEGNHQEEARWANLIGDILKNRGEYVEALKWLRIDYEVSVKYLPEKHVLPTCQSLGEVYLRLQHFKDALVYQKKHLELAKDSNDLVEQQRASTQLGRTYHEMFTKSEDDHYSVRNAKKYFKVAMNLARTLKENASFNRTSSFLKEYIDAHNNIGMLEMDLDNFEAAEKILTKGLKICDEEEVNENDDARSRLHHNLGYVYTALRMWDKAREHIEKDIIICKNIQHWQGQAKGYINLGEFHYKVQKYDDAILCYRKAHDLAKSMEDEDALIDQIKQNIEIVEEAKKVMDGLNKEEQNLKKLMRNMVTARGTQDELKCLQLQIASLDRLIESSSMIFAWKKHKEYAKRKKRIATELCDKEKLSDSFLNIGESYNNLRNFKKALKWYKKSWEIYKSIGNLEGQALVKNHIGDALDSGGNWAEALKAFEENNPSIQLSALENMHYSNMIRFDNVEEAKRLQNVIENLKQSKSKELNAHKSIDCCPETDAEEDDCLSNSRSSACQFTKKSNSSPGKPNSVPSVELEDDMPLISLLLSLKNSPGSKTAHSGKRNALIVNSPKISFKSISNQENGVARKRARIVLSDDEGETVDGLDCPNDKIHIIPLEDVATSDELKTKSAPSTSAWKFQDNSPVASKCAISSCTPIYAEESICSHKCMSPKVTAGKDTCSGPFSNDERWLNIRIDNHLVPVEAVSCVIGSKLSVESLKVEAACEFYLRLPSENRSKGLLPIIGNMECDGRILESFEEIETLKDGTQRKGWIKASVDAWVQRRLMKLYIDCCKKLSETPIMKLLKKLYNLEVSEDEVSVSECDLQDISVRPLLDALDAYETVAMLDLSHNLLGNGTMEKLQQVFRSSCQTYGGLTLNLHTNRFGPTSLFQICECPVLFTRLEVLNISGNRLTDACASYLSAILMKCKALYSLNVERCSITTRTIQKVADALDARSALTHLSLGHNNPVSGNALVNLLDKLATLSSFSEINLNGVKISKSAIDGLCRLAKTSCLSGLMLGSTGIGGDGALQVCNTIFSGTQELMKLDLSCNGLTSQFIMGLKICAAFVSTVAELNIGGNPITQEGGDLLASILMNPQCCLKVLVINKCQLGFTGVLKIIRALAENDSLKELNLAENAILGKQLVLQNDLTTKSIMKPLQINLPLSELSHNSSSLKKSTFEASHQGLNAVSTERIQLEVADSEDNLMVREPAISNFDDECTSSSQKDPSNPECQYIQELSTSISMAINLKLLDLSDNGFSAETVDKLYTAWSSSDSRAGLSQRHVRNQIIHFSVQEIKCCGDTMAQ
ncbi:Tetratricopeptide repeat [Dillenia turbinata]|uniref:Protein TONSOKU n=1 Tax=Dillenia turbinata TaxID=194707 RepID=A0AAN8UVW0_9MAGN